jgi:hypothetical protein
MLEFRLASDAAAVDRRCSVGQCAEAGSCTPVLRIALFGSLRVSRVPLPARLCAKHATSFPERFLTASRRAAIETALRSRGRNAPDWARTDVVFE